MAGKFGEDFNFGGLASKLFARTSPNFANNKCDVMRTNHAHIEALYMYTFIYETVLAGRLYYGSRVDS